MATKVTPPGRIVNLELVRGQRDVETIGRQDCTIAKCIIESAELGAISFDDAADRVLQALLRRRPHMIPASGSPMRGLASGA